MIFAHLIVGAMPIDHSEFSWYLFIGSIIADVDHLFVLYKNKIFSWEKFIDVMRFEDKYGLRFKTKYAHSIFGAVVATLPVLFINIRGALYFFIAYIISLLLDWPDIDEKQFLYPFKKKFRGFLPILSKIEIAFTVLLIGFYLFQIKVF